MPRCLEDPLLTRRRGQAFLAEIILSLVIIIALASLTNWMKTSINEGTPDVLCKSSLSAKILYLEKKQTYSGQAATIAIPEPSLDCEMAIQTASGDANAQIITISNAIRNCYDKTLRNSNKIALMLEEGQNYCIDCARITPTTDIEVSAIKQYLNKNKMPGASATYQEYLQTSHGKLTLPNMFIDPIDMEDPMPGTGGAMTRLSKMTKDQPIDIIAMNRNTENGMLSHIVVIPTNKLSRLTCQELYQQKGAGNK